jgi:phosphoesterase RecJ-like protein
LNKYKDALDLIHNAHYIVIISHINPDADTLSCSLAMSNYLSENNIKHKVFNKQDDLPKNLDYLHGYNKITNQLPKSYDLAIYMDCGDIHRPAITIDENCKIINFDHHQSNDDFGFINFVDDSKASTAEILFDFFIKNDLVISKNMAECLYTGIYDDSLAFTTPRTDANTFRAINFLVKCGVNPGYVASQLTQRQSIAKLQIQAKVVQSLELYEEGRVAVIYVLPQWLEQTGATYKDCDEVINQVLNLAVVDIAIFLRVSDGRTRVSLRSKEAIDISKVATHFNGGGHKNAAGCRIESQDIEESKKIILNYIQNME